MAKTLKLKLDLVSIVKKITTDEQKLNVFIPLVTGDGFKHEFGLRAIDRLQERMDDGIDKNSRAFKGYSTAYKNSDAFKIYGKSAGQVNMQLTGAMRASIDVVDTTSRSVTLGFVDSEENDKAHGHVNGANYLPVRDFWGLPDKDLKKIMTEMIKDFADQGDLVITEVQNVIVADVNIEEDG